MEHLLFLIIEDLDCKRSRQDEIKWREYDVVYPYMCTARDFRSRRS